VTLKGLDAHPEHPNTPWRCVTVVGDDVSEAIAIGMAQYLAEFPVA
jgi:hypothetical protein